MADALFAVIELGVVFGAAIAWGLWELRSVRRVLKASARRDAPVSPADDPGT